MFEKYLGLLLKWNRAYSLTAIDDPAEIYEKHFDDSAIPLEFIKKGASLMDIGSGAGFPGIPIKILRKDIDVTLMDSVTKKVTFCEHVIRELGLEGIRVITGRAEDEGILKKTGKFDVVISRATLKLSKLVKVAGPYLKADGRLIAMMGPSWPEDLGSAGPAIKKAGLNLIKVHEYLLPVSQSRRALLIFERE